jgi:hypothetical protein
LPFSDWPHCQPSRLVRTTPIATFVDELGQGKGAEASNAVITSQDEVFQYYLWLAQIDDIAGFSIDSSFGNSESQGCYGFPRIAREQNPAPGDVVLIRQSELDKQRGRKLEPKWEGPYVVTRYSKGGRFVFLAMVSNPEMGIAMGMGK